MFLSIVNHWPFECQRTRNTSRNLGEWCISSGLTWLNTCIIFWAALCCWISFRDVKQWLIIKLKLWEDWALIYLPLNKAAVLCYHGSTSARHEQPLAWRLWSRTPDQVWARPVLPRYTAPCSLAGDHHPESPLHWRGAAAWQTDLVMTRRRLCWSQGSRPRALPPKSRYSPLHLLQKKRKPVNKVHGKRRKEIHVII